MLDLRRLLRGCSMQVLHYLRIGWSKIPLLGPLVDVQTKDHLEAITEVGLNIVLSTVPIWFGAAIMLLAERNNGSFFSLMTDNMRSGEFCLYSTALLAPLYYFIFKNYQSRPQFPSGRIFMVTAALIILWTSGLFVVQRTESIGGNAAHLNNDLIFSWSWQIYIAAVVIVYFTHVYKNFMETGAASITDNETQNS